MKSPIRYCYEAAAGSSTAPCQHGNYGAHTVPDGNRVRVETDGDWRARAKQALNASVSAFSLALEVDDRRAQLRHSDPEYDACTRVAQKYREIGDTLAELHETFTLYADSAAQVGAA